MISDKDQLNFNDSSLGGDCQQYGEARSVSGPIRLLVTQSMTCRISHRKSPQWKCSIVEGNVCIIICHSQHIAVSDCVWLLVHYQSSMRLFQLIFEVDGPSFATDDRCLLIYFACLCDHYAVTVFGANFEVQLSKKLCSLNVQLSDLLYWTLKGGSWMGGHLGQRCNGFMCTVLYAISSQKLLNIYFLSFAQTFLKVLSLCTNM